MKRFLAVLVIMAMLMPTATSAQQTDAFDFSQAQIVDAPDVRQWPATTHITSLSFDGAVTRVDFTKKNGPGRWPDVRPAGWTGDLQYTLWLCVQTPGWTCSAFIQFWNGRDGSGSPADPDVPSVYDKHWYYAPRWSPIYGHGPLKPGELIGFLVTSGNQRDAAGPDSVQERSNVVVVPAADRASYTFDAPPPPPVPVPVPPTPQPQPQPLDLSHIEQLILQVNQNVTDGRAENQAFYSNVKSTWQAIGGPFIVKYILPALGSALATWQVTKK